MSGSRSRTKGANGEREFISEMNLLLGDSVRLRRRIAQTRDGGYDVEFVDSEGNLVETPFLIEIKKHAVPRVNSWWLEAVGYLDAGANGGGKIPVLAYRIDRKKWRAVIALADLIPESFGRQLRSLEMSAEVGLEALAAIIRERL